MYVGDFFLLLVYLGLESCVGSRQYVWAPGRLRDILAKIQSSDWRQCDVHDLKDLNLGSQIGVPFKVIILPL